MKERELAIVCAGLLNVTFEEPASCLDLNVLAAGGGEAVHTGSLVYVQHDSDPDPKPCMPGCPLADGKHGLPWHSAIEVGLHGLLLCPPLPYTLPGQSAVSDGVLSDHPPPRG